LAVTDGVWYHRDCERSPTMAKKGQPEGCVGGEGIRQATCRAAGEQCPCGHVGGLGICAREAPSLACHVCLWCRRLPLLAVPRPCGCRHAGRGLAPTRACPPSGASSSQTHALRRTNCPRLRGGACAGSAGAGRWGRAGVYVQWLARRASCNATDWHCTEYAGPRSAPQTCPPPPTLMQGICMHEQPFLCCLDT
jgi:hypothetical protein